MNTLPLLLRSVQSNPVITQRLLAKKLNISSPCLLKLTFENKELVHLEQIV